MQGVFLKLFIKLREELFEGDEVDEDEERINEKREACLKVIGVTVVDTRLPFRSVKLSTTGKWITIEVGEIKHFQFLRDTCIRYNGMRASGLSVSYGIEKLYRYACLKVKMEEELDKTK